MAAISEFLDFFPEFLVLHFLPFPFLHFLQVAKKIPITAATVNPARRDTVHFFVHFSLQFFILRYLFRLIFLLLNVGRSFDV